MQTRHFTPPQIAKLFSVNQSTIKRWVDKGMLPATKTPGGHRHISLQDLQTFIASYPRYQHLSYVLKNLTTQSTTLDWKEYYIYIQNDLYDEALQILRSFIIQNISLITILDAVISPVFGRIQSAWQSNTIPLYEQHRMIMLLERQLIELQQYIIHPKKQTNAPTAFLVTVPGDVHELGLRMAALILEQHGYHIISPGVHVPAEEIYTAITNIKPTLVCIAHTTSTVNPDNFLQQVKNTTKPLGSHILLGGSGWSETQRTKNHFIQHMKDFDSLVKSFSRSRQILQRK